MGMPWATLGKSNECGCAAELPTQKDTPWPSLVPVPHMEPQAALLTAPSSVCLSWLQGSCVSFKLSDPLLVLQGREPEEPEASGAWRRMDLDSFSGVLAGLATDLQNQGKHGVRGWGYRCNSDRGGCKDSPALLCRVLRGAAGSTQGSGACALHNPKP